MLADYASYYAKLHDQLVSEQAALHPDTSLDRLLI
jgi:hypothetical protein